MLKGISRTRLAVAWCAAVVVMAALSVVLGARLTMSVAELWLALFVVPPLVMWLVWRNGVAQPVTELVYDFNQDSRHDKP